MTSLIPGYIRSFAIDNRINVGTRWFDYADGRSVQRPTIFCANGKTLDYADSWKELLPKMKGALRRKWVGVA